MPFHFPTQFDDGYWTTSKWLRVPCIAASSVSPIYLVTVGASWGVFMLVNFLPLVWASIHLVLLRRGVIFHPLLNASFDLLSIASYIRTVFSLTPGLGEYVYMSITGPFMLAAMYGRNILVLIWLRLCSLYMQILFWRFVPPRSDAIPAIWARVCPGWCCSCLIK